MQISGAEAAKPLCREQGVSGPRQFIGAHFIPGEGCGRHAPIWGRGPLHARAPREQPPEPPCTCERIDVDLYDPRGCERCAQPAVALIEAAVDVWAELPAQGEIDLRDRSPEVPF